MAYEQQINQEQEALETEPKLKLVQKYLPETETYLSYKYRIKNRRHVLKKLQRAGVVIKAQKTDKTRKLHPKATLIAETVLNKIAYDEEEEVILTHKYLNKITDCLADQNKRHIKQLDNLFDAKYERAYLKDGKFYEYCYVFKLNPAITEELKEVGLLESEFIPAKKPRSINNENISNEIKIRSSRANFFNSNFNSQKTSTELVENSSRVAKEDGINSSADTQTFEQAETLHEPQAVEPTSPTPATVTPIQTKARPANKRKTKTKAEEKQRRTNNVVRNGFLGKGKRLSEVQPYLTDEICETLRSGSGRDFTNKAIREITKAIAASEKGAQAFFYHINGLVAYLIPALIREKRDPNKVGGENYYTIAGMTEEDKLLHEREKYLNETENSAIYARCDYTQYRARIAGQFPVNLAYALLTSMTGVKRQGSVLQITMHKLVPLSQHYKQLLLKHAAGVGGYAGVSELEFVGIANNSNIASKLSRNCESQTSATSQSTVVPDLVQREELQLPEGIWGKVCSLFISQQEGGEALYKHWLAPLSVLEKEGIIELSTSSDMVRDRIEQTYLPFLVKLAGEFGINKVEFVE